jgi:hypothetical protein
MWILSIGEYRDAHYFYICTLLFRIWDVKDIESLESYAKTILYTQNNLKDYILETDNLYYHILKKEHSELDKQELCNRCLKELKNSLETFLSESVYILQCKTLEVYPSNINCLIETGNYDAVKLATKIIEVLI